MEEKTYKKLPNLFVREKFYRLFFIYDLLGPLKKMFWVSVLLMVFSVVWEGVILAAVATMFQSLIDNTRFSASTFEQDSFMSWVYGYFHRIPDEYRVIAGFTFAAITVLIGSVINAGVATFQTNFSTRFIINVRCSVFEKLYKSSLSYFDNQKKGSLITMVVNESRSCYNVLKSTLQLLIALFRTIVLIGVLLAISPHLTGLVIIISAVFLVETVMISRIIKKLSEIVVKKTRALTVDADESLQGVKLVKLFNLHDDMNASFRQNCSIADFTNRKQTLIIQWQVVFANTILILTVLSLIYLNISFSLIAISLMLTYLYALQKLNQSLTEVNNHYGRFNQEIPRLDRIMEFFNHYNLFNEKTGKIAPEKLMQKSLILENVSFRYKSITSVKSKSKIDDCVLKNISLSINQGQTIALVGESGSGKTSLVNLIVRLYEPTGGRILIDDVDIREFDLSFLRNRIGIVNQDTILFNKSIRENLFFGRQSATEPEMIDVAKKAHIHGFVTQFPDGYDTVIGDRGVKLSGGQRQRLNIAQVFLKKPEIMIFDEATSALDSKSEEYIKNSINEITQNCTSIIIAHRLSTVKHADKVFVLDKGNIIEEGNWESLMKSKGVFNEMVQKQFFIKE